MSPHPAQVVGSARVRRRGMSALLSSLIGSPGGASALECVAHVPPDLASGAVGQRRKWRHRVGEGVAEEALRKHSRGPPASLLSPPSPEPGLLTISLNSCIYSASLYPVPAVCRAASWRWGSSAECQTFSGPHVPTT